MAVRSVIEIDVNDTAFKTFAATFEKYQAALKKLPGSWGDLDKGVQKTGVTFTEMLAVVLAQMEIWKHTGEHVEKIQQQTIKTRDGWRDISKSAKETAATVARTTIEIAKWLGIGSIFTGLVGGVGAFGLDRLAHGAANQYKSASGIGVSTGQANAFRINYGQFLDNPTGVLSAVTAAKSSLEGQANFVRLGISDWQHKGNAELAQEVIEKSAQLYKQSPNIEFLNSRGVTAFLSQEDARRAAGGDLGGARSQFGKDVGALSRSPDVDLKWQTFLNRIDAAGEQIDNVFRVGLSGLGVPLGKLSDQFSHLVDVFFKNAGLEHWIDVIGEGLDKFATEIETGDFDTKVAEFGKAFDDLIHWVGGWLEYLGVKGKSAATGAATALTTTMSPKTQAEYAAGTGPGAHERNAKAMQRYLMASEGLTEAEAAALVGNFDAESELDPLAKNKKSGAFGIGQWLGPRKADLMSGKYGDPNDVMTQLRFVGHELHSTEANTLAQLKAASARGAPGTEMSDIVMNTYERPSDQEKNGSRIRRELTTVRILIDNPAGAAVSASAATGSVATASR